MHGTAKKFEKQIYVAKTLDESHIPNPTNLPNH